MRFKDDTFFLVHIKHVYWYVISAIPEVILQIHKHWYGDNQHFEHIYVHVLYYYVDHKKKNWNHPKKPPTLNPQLIGVGNLAGLKINVSNGILYTVLVLSTKYRTFRPYFSLKSFTLKLIMQYLEIPYNMFIWRGLFIHCPLYLIWDKFFEK